MQLISIVAAVLLTVQSAGTAQTPASPAAPKPAAQKAADVGVTVTYKGKGTVDAAHKLIVFAFSNPDITSTSRPFATQFASRNGDTVTFKDVTAPVYVFAVYDEKGTYDGVSGPPPPGIPCATYRKTPKGTPATVAPGTAPVKFAFDDSERWSK